MQAGLGLAQSEIDAIGQGQNERSHAVEMACPQSQQTAWRTDAADRRSALPAFTRPDHPGQLRRGGYDGGAGGGGTGACGLIAERPQCAAEAHTSLMSIHSGMGMLLALLSRVYVGSIRPAKLFPIMVQ